MAAISEHPDAADREVALLRIVVEQRDRNVRAVGVEQHCANGPLTTVAGSEDDGSFAVMGQGPPLLLEELPGDIASAAHSEERDDPCANHRTHRRRSVTRDSKVDGDEGKG